MDKVEEELRSGYQRIKLKIKPGKDLEYVAALRERFPAILLSVDANSAYRLQDVDHLRRFDEFELLMMEQPLAWDDIYSHAQLQAQIRTPVCLDECINNAGHALAAIRMRACKVINVKLGRVGGHTGALGVHDICREHSLPVWCGGMLESGIGRAHNIAMSTLPGFTLPGDVSASSRYWDEDIVEPQIEVTPGGTIRVPRSPGLGFEVKRDLVNRLSVRSREIGKQWRQSVFEISTSGLDNDEEIPHSHCGTGARAILRFAATASLILRAQIGAHGIVGFRSGRRRTVAATHSREDQSGDFEQVAHEFRQ